MSLVLCKIADCARMVFIRVQSAIRADGLLSAQAFWFRRNLLPSLASAETLVTGTET
jgi:hypothetical protein